MTHVMSIGRVIHIGQKQADHLAKYRFGIDGNSMTKRDDGVYEVKADVVLADEKLPVGDTAEMLYKGKEVIYVEPTEDEDPYWNRWAGSGMKIIIG